MQPSYALPPEGENTPDSFAFGPFVLVPGRQLLLEDGVPVRIGRRALDILTALVQRQGDVVSKDELMAHAWPNSVVEDGNLKVNIGALRRALGDDHDQPRYIATVVGRGYRFITPVRRSGLDAPSSTSNALPKRADNLPTGSTRIFGRGPAIASISQELERARLVSIVGPGGMGKTTVALAIAHAAASAFEDGAWFVDLAAVNDESLVPDAVATAIGLKVPLRDNSAALYRYLHDREMLLVLDNCEHLIDAVASCAARALTTAKNVKFLTTSRESLCIKGERVRRLSGLTTPPSSSRIRAEEALEYSAIQLFVDRATRKLPSFALSDANAPAVAEICRRMDGLALAIECIATRIDTIGIGKMLDYIDSRFYMFDGCQAGLERHRTMAATIDWSHQLLSESEKAVLRRLSTFSGAFSLESACAVGAGDGVDPVTVVEDVASLAAKSLLVTEARDGEMEYRLTNVVGAFALEKLAANGEVASARRRHANHFLQLAEQAGADYDRLSNVEWVARHGAKNDDIRAALNWAFGDRDSAVLAVRLAVSAIPFWKQHAPTDECRAAIARALEGRYGAYRSARDELALNAALGETLFKPAGDSNE